MRRLLGALVAAGIALTAPRAHACAGCRNPNLPITRIAEVHLRPGQVRLAATAGATWVHVVHEAGCRTPDACDDFPAQPLHLHDQRLLPTELRTSTELGLTRHIGIELQLPLRLTRTTIDYKTPSGAPYEPLDPGIHHRNETLAGLSDPSLLGRISAGLPGTLLTARLGVSVPLGRTEDNPFALGAKGQRHQHVQFGTGTFDPVLGLDVSRPAGRLLLAGYVQGQASLYEGRRGYRSGLRLLGGIQAGHHLWEHISGALGVDVMHEGAERWDGRIQQDGSLGRTELLIGAALTRTVATTTLGLGLRVPVWRRIVRGDEPPGTLSSPVMLSLVGGHVFGR